MKIDTNSITSYDSAKVGGSFAPGIVSMGDAPCETPNAAIMKAIRTSIVADNIIRKFKKSNQNEDIVLAVHAARRVSYFY